MNHGSLPCKYFSSQLTLLFNVAGLVLQSFCDEWDEAADQAKENVGEFIHVIAEIHE